MKTILVELNFLRELIKGSKIDNAVRGQVEKYRLIFQLSAAYIGSLITVFVAPLAVSLDLWMVKDKMEVDFFKYYFIYLIINQLSFFFYVFGFRYFIKKRKLFEHKKYFKTLLFAFIIQVTLLNFSASFISYSFGAELISLAYVVSFFFLCMLFDNKERLYYLVFAILLFGALLMYFSPANHPYLIDTLVSGLIALGLFYVFGGIIYNNWLNATLNREKYKNSMLEIKANHDIISSAVDKQKNTLRLICEKLNVDPEFMNSKTDNAPLELFSKIDFLIDELAEKQKETVNIKDRYIDIFNNVIDGIVILNEHNEIMDVNKKAKEILSLPDDFIDLRKTLDSALSLGDNPSVREFYELLKKESSISDFEIQYKNTENQTTYLEISASSIRDIKNSYQGARCIIRDITERKNTEQALLEARNAEKNFLTNMSHEIRTPLNAIIGMSHLIYDTKLNQEQKELVDVINNSSLFLYNLISDILDIAKIEASQLQIRKRPFHLVGLLRTIQQSYELKLDGRDIDFELFVDGKLQGIFNADDTLLNQVLYNLVGNANKFTEKGTIGIKVKLLNTVKDMHLIEFQVYDTGIGIPKEDLKQIFDKFKQAHTQDQSKTRGTGLGLAICKEIIEKMGGEISIESEVNVGTKVTFSFMMEKENEDKLTEQDKYLTGSAPIDDSTSLKGLNFLIVEDNMMNQKYVKSLLDRKEIKYEAAKNGEEAIEFAKNQKFDVILMDIQMPVKNGIEATISIRNSENPNKKTPIIALTASALASQKEEAMKVGMNSFLTKPFTPDVFFETLKVYLKN